MRSALAEEGIGQQIVVAGIEEGHGWIAAVVGTEVECGIAVATGVAGVQQQRVYNKRKYIYNCMFQLV